jgi:hypothetical protein
MMTSRAIRPLVFAAALCVAHAGRADAQGPPVSPEILAKVPAGVLRAHGVTAAMLQKVPAQVWITITAVSPAQTWQSQPFIATYMVTNLTGSNAKGAVTAFLDSKALSLPGDPPLDLAPGASITREIHASAGLSAVQHLRVRYQDGVHCHRVPLWTGGSREVCIADMSADDSLELDVRSLASILTSPDTPAGLTPQGGEICGNGTDTYPSVGVPYEWADTQNGVDVPALGNVITPKGPGADVPFSHPFEFDYTYGVVLDRAYWPLLNPRGFESSSDCSPAGLSSGRGDQDICAGFPIAHVRHYSDGPEGAPDNVGILHSEIENGLIPDFFKPRDGDRVYMRGRRIVDCGHNNFVAEIHPPTIIATARRLDSGTVFSTVVGTPYRTLQNYGGAQRNFHETVAAEIAAITATPVPLSLVANVTNRPFERDIVATYRVGVPPVAGKGIPALRYHFTTRPGVSVTVNRVSDFEAEVVVSIRAGAYSPPPPAICGTRQITLADAEKLANMAPGTLTGLFNKYIQPATYTSPLWAPLLIVVPVLGPWLAVEAPHWLIDAVVSAQLGLNIADCRVTDSSGGGNPASAVPFGQLLDNQVTQSSVQPYPVIGWLQMDFGG